MIALGLLLLVAAAVVTLVGVLTNSGGAHALNSDFSLLGYHFHGSTGQLLLIGVIVGAVGMLGLNMLLAGVGRGFSRRVSTRRELKQSRHQAGALHEERDTWRTSSKTSGSPARESKPSTQRAPGTRPTPTRSTRGHHPPAGNQESPRRPRWPDDSPWVLAIVATPGPSRSCDGGAWSAGSGTTAPRVIRRANSSRVPDCPERGKRAGSWASTPGRENAGGQTRPARWRSTELNAGGHGSARPAAPSTSGPAGHLAREGCGSGDRRG